MGKLHGAFPLFVARKLPFKRLVAYWSGVKTYVIREATKIDQRLFVHLVSSDSIGNAFGCLGRVVLYQLTNQLKTLSGLLGERSDVLINRLNFLSHRVDYCRF